MKNKKVNAQFSMLLVLVLFLVAFLLDAKKMNGYFWR